MAETSTFYFNSNATATPSREFIREIPTFAVHALDGYSFSSGWQSNKVTSKTDLRDLAWGINLQVPVHLAVPRVIAHKLFTPGKRFSKIAVYAYRPVADHPWGNGYQVGPSIALVLQELTVTSVTPIVQWSGLPSLMDDQRNYLEKMFGPETYNPVAVKFQVLGECDMVE